MRFVGLQLIVALALARHAEGGSNFWNTVTQPAQAKHATDELLRQVRRQKHRHKKTPRDPESQREERSTTCVQA